MTKKIADTLSDTFQYYIENLEGSYNDICARTIIFIYAVSGVDLTYLHFIAKSDAENVQKTLTEIVDEIFHAFVGKESIRSSELENLVYNRKFGEYWNIGCNIKNISRDNYFNFISDNSLEDSKDQVIERGKKAEENIENLIYYILDLIDSDSMETFSEKHGAVNNIARLPIKSKTWKAYYLSEKFDFFYFTEQMKELINGLRVTNLYMEVNSKFNFLISKINKAIDKKNISEENMLLFKSNRFEEIKNELKESISFIQFQVRVNKEQGTFGSCHCRMNSVKNPEIDEVRKFISIMVEYLFYGVSSKIGVVDNKNELKEKHDDTIYLYISGKQKKFTKKTKSALYYRIKYHLDKNEYFFKMLWQLFYYVFGMDFYMLNNVNKNNDWLKLIDKTLLLIENGKSMDILEKYISWKYDILQCKYENEMIFSFTPDEIEFFRKCDVVGYNGYIHIYENIIGMDMDFDITELRNEVTMKYIQVKINALLSELQETVKFIEELLKARSPNEIFRKYENYDVTVTEEKLNWKYKLYFYTQDENKIRVTINQIRLEQLIKFISVYASACRFYCNKFEFEMNIDIIRSCIKRMLHMPYKKYESYYEKSDDRASIKQKEIFNKTNMEFLNSYEIKSLYAMTKMMYKYLRYSEWIDKNIRFE